MINAVKEDTYTTLTEASSLKELYEGLEPLHLTPGWIDREKPILWEQPSTPFVVKHWEYEYCKSALEAAGRLINTNLAERRNLILRNPVKGNDFATTRTLVNAYQMILPGEEARTHRHAPHALRVIIESEKSFSVVNGEKHPMETGDIVLTPGWCWHGHGHDGDRPAYWLDGLDVPLTHLVEPMFFEEHPAGFAPVERITPDSPYRFTWDTIQKRTEIADKDGDGYFGQRVRLEAAEMPTIGIFVERLEAGQKTRRFRHSANLVYSPMQGSGTSFIGSEEIIWKRGDTFAAPTWNWIEHDVKEDTILFAMTDEFLMRFCNYYRFEGVN